MLLIEGEARYADLIELQLYNAMLSGVSLDGETYFYQNPLSDEGNHRRSPWFTTACCPPNVARTLASLPGYVYGISDDTIWVHLYAEGTGRIALPNGRTIELRQRTRYPWDGEIEVEVANEGSCGLRLRIPGWAGPDAELTVNGQPVDGQVVPGSYAEVRRDWRVGDVVRLALPMPVRRIEAHPYVTEDTRRVALMRGPLLFCVEQADNPGVELRDVVLRDGTEFTERFRSDLLDGVVTLTAPASLVSPDSSWSDRLYRPAEAASDAAQTSSVEITAIPYYAWANREPGRMRVWLPREG
jgi:DUF1680 family protein